jgi:hypothetical protein
MVRGCKLHLAQDRVQFSDYFIHSNKYLDSTKGKEYFEKLGE